MSNVIESPQIIYKYPLELTLRQKISLPIGYKILSVQVQKGEIQLWALVDKLQRFKDSITIEIQPTGSDIKPLDDFFEKKRKFISTIQLNGGSLVFHIFQIL